MTAKKRQTRHASNSSKKIEPKSEKLLVKLGMFVYRHIRTMLIAWLLLIVGGVLAYTTLLDREGFPPIRVPYAVANGTYLVDSPKQVDRQVAQPLSEALSGNEQILELQTTAGDNFFNVVATFDQDVSSAQATDILQKAIDDANVLPEEANIEYLTIDPGKFLNKYDVLISAYATDQTSLKQLEEQAADAAAALMDVSPAINTADVQSQFQTAVNPQTGKQQTLQSSFSNIGVRQDGDFTFYPSVTIGVKGAEDYDIIELSNAVEEAVAQVEARQSEDAVNLAVAADYGPSIQTQIDSLQSNLLTGLIAVSVVSFLLITWRASLITAIFMLSVMLGTLLVLWGIDYSLNTISLFALVLALGLFVDDATIIVEAIDANRKRGSAKQVVRLALRKVASASFAGTMTTVLVFLPLVFISGLLGEFIRILPVTIIVALLTSLVLSLTLIPFLSRFVLLRKSIIKAASHNPIARVEKRIAAGLAGTIKMIKRGRKGMAVAVAMLLVPFVMLFAGFYYAGQLQFNIFPITKDTDQLQVTLNFAPDTSIQEATRISSDVNSTIKRTLGSELVNASYFDSSQRSAAIFIELTPFTEREVKSPQLVERLQQSLESVNGVRARVVQIDAGPPEAEFPFRVQIYSENQAAASSLAQDINDFLDGATVERLNGTTARITKTDIQNQDQIVRRDGDRYLEVLASYDAQDTTALVEGTQTLVEEEFNQTRLAEYDLQPSALEFDFGQESENQESFSSLLLIGPISLIAMFALLAVQFRSLLQPLLIFMAIPFSIFGVMYGLYVSDNSISFFSMIGFFGLIGIAVNNTILLTDYANQEQREGRGLVDATANAAQKRFRPLLSTSLTTVVALLPLALTDPFWEPLAFTIIFGLLSSTLLVIISFPYYYLFAEKLRRTVKAKIKGRK